MEICIYLLASVVSLMVNPTAIHALLECAGQLNKSSLRTLTGQRIRSIYVGSDWTVRYGKATAIDRIQVSTFMIVKDERPLRNFGGLGPSQCDGLRYGTSAVRRLLSRRSM